MVAQIWVGVSLCVRHPGKVPAISAAHPHELRVAAMILLGSDGSGAEADRPLELRCGLLDPVCRTPTILKIGAEHDNTDSNDIWASSGASMSPPIDGTMLGCLRRCTPADNGHGM